MPPIKAKLVDSLALPGGGTWGVDEKAMSVSGVLCTEAVDFDDDGSGVVPCLDPLKLTLEYGNAEAWKPPAPVLVGIKEA